MQALICTKPQQFDYANIPEPIMGNGETILKIERVGICGTDLHAFEGTQPYFNYPRILGHEIAATIVKTTAVDFTVGEAVTCIPYFNCNNCIACKMNKPNCCTNINVCGVHINGAMCTYLSVPSYSLVKGNNLSFDELALVEPLAIGAHGVRRANILPDEFVLVVGAGPIGLGIIEFARIAGAKVIAMDVNDNRLEFCKNNLGVVATINPSSENIVEKLQAITNHNMPTVVIDATGNLNAINNAFNLLAHGGRYVLVGLQKGEISFSHPEFHKREASVMSSRNATREDFEQVIFAMKNKLVDPTTYITHRVKFDEVKDQFSSWLNPSTGVIKAMIEM